MAYVAGSWMNSNAATAPAAAQANAGTQVYPNQAPQGGTLRGGGNFNSPAGTAPRPPGDPSQYADQYQRFAAAGGLPGRFQPRMGVQGPQYRPGTNLQQPPPGTPPKPTDVPPTDPPEYGLPNGGADPGADVYGNAPSIDTYMRRPPYVRPRFGGP